MQFNWSSLKRGAWESFLPWRRCGGGRGSWGADSDGTKAWFSRSETVDLVVFFLFGLLAEEVILPLEHFEIFQPAFRRSFQFEPLKIEISHWILSTFTWSSCHSAGEFLLHLGKRNGRGGLSSLGYVAGHESEDYNWWPHSLQRWRMFWRVLFRGFQLRRRLSMLHVGPDFQVWKDL